MTDEVSFPKFPRGFSNEARNRLAKDASDKWADDIIGTAKSARVKLSALDELLIKMIGTMLVHQKWAAERIAELEGQKND